jgi:hypothetical protein
VPKAQDCDFTNQLYLATELSVQPQTAVGSKTMITGLVIMLLAADRSQGCWRLEVIVSFHSKDLGQLLGRCENSKVWAGKSTDTNLFVDGSV